MLRGDSATAAEAKRALIATRLEEYIQRVIGGAPPLTAEQRDRLVAILHSGMAGDDTGLARHTSTGASTTSTGCAAPSSEPGTGGDAG